MLNNHLEPSILDLEFEGLLKSDLDEALDWLLKGAGHKYLKRLTNNAPPPKFRYVYSVGSMRAGAGPPQVGDKIHGDHDGKSGHWEVTDTHDDGHVTIKHDESGASKRIHASALHEQFTSEHGEAIKATHEKLKRVSADAAATGTAKQKERAKAALDAHEGRYGLKPAVERVKGKKGKAAKPIPTMKPGDEPKDRYAIEPPEEAPRSIEQVKRSEKHHEKEMDRLSQLSDRAEDQWESHYFDGLSAMHGSMMSAAGRPEQAAEHHDTARAALAQAKQLYAGGAREARGPIEEMGPDAGKLRGIEKGSTITTPEGHVYRHDGDGALTLLHNSGMTTGDGAPLHGHSYKQAEKINDVAGLESGYKNFADEKPFRVRAPKDVRTLDLFGGASSPGQKINDLIQPKSPPEKEAKKPEPEKPKRTPVKKPAGAEQAKPAAKEEPAKPTKTLGDVFSERDKAYAEAEAALKASNERDKARHAKMEADYAEKQERAGVAGLEEEHGVKIHRYDDGRYSVTDPNPVPGAKEPQGMYSHDEMHGVLERYAERKEEAGKKAKVTEAEAKAATEKAAAAKDVIEKHRSLMRSAAADNHSPSSMKALRAHEAEHGLEPHVPDSPSYKGDTKAQGTHVPTKASFKVDQLRVSPSWIGTGAMLTHRSRLTDKHREQMAAVNAAGNAALLNDPTVEGLISRSKDGAKEWKHVTDTPDDKHKIYRSGDDVIAMDKKLDPPSTLHGGEGSIVFTDHPTSPGYIAGRMNLWNTDGKSALKDAYHALDHKDPKVVAHAHSVIAHHSSEVPYKEREKITPHKEAASAHRKAAVVLHEAGEHKAAEDHENIAAAFHDHVARNKGSAFNLREERYGSKNPATDPTERKARREAAEERFTDAASAAEKSQRAEHLDLVKAVSWVR